MHWYTAKSSSRLHLHFIKNLFQVSSTYIKSWRFHFVFRNTKSSSAYKSIKKWITVPGSILTCCSSRYIGSRWAVLRRVHFNLFLWFNICKKKNQHDPQGVNGLHKRWFHYSQLRQACTRSWRPQLNTDGRSGRVYRSVYLYLTRKKGKDKHVEKTSARRSATSAQIAGIAARGGARYLNRAKIKVKSDNSYQLMTHSQ